MTKQISRVLTDILTEQGLGEFSSGQTVLENGVIRIKGHFSCAGPEQAMELFQKFDGSSGWLCTAESKKIYIIRPDMPAEYENDWPRWGELVSQDGKTSLHLRHNGSNWTVTLLEGVKGEPGDSPVDSIICKTSLPGHGWTLQYHVLYEPVSVNGLEQYTATLSRFTGLKKGAKP